MSQQDADVTSLAEELWAEYYKLDREMAALAHRTDDKGSAEFDGVRNRWFAVRSDLETIGAWK